MSRKLLILIFIPFFLFTAALGCRENTSPGVKSITLSVWGIFDTRSDLQEVFNAYKRVRPEVIIDYRTIALDEYEKLLLDSLAAGEGPDAFIIHNRWTDKFQNKVVPAPADKFSLQEFKDTFVSVVSEDMIRDNQILGAPMYVDTLGMYYNYSHYRRTEKGRPQETWDGFLKDLGTLSDSYGDTVINSGVALGTDKSVHQSVDILLNIFLQNGLQFYSPDGNTVRISDPEAVNAMKFYTDFANPESPYFSWNNELGEDDLYAFIHGKTSTIIGYSYLAEQIAAQARTSGLDFRTAKFPQFDEKNPINLADYWAYTVKKNPSQNLRERYAWDLIKFMTSKEGEKLYTDKVHRPPSRRDLIDSYVDDPTYGPFVDQARFARSIQMYDREKYQEALEDAIEEVNGGLLPSQALQKASKTIQDLVNLYKK